MNPQLLMVNRRAFLAGVAAFGAVAFAGGSAVAAPRSGGGSLSSYAQDGSAPAGQIILARTMSELTTLHPQLERFTSALAISYHVNEGLVKFAPTFELVPGLASDWTVSDDQLTLHLQPAARRDLARWPALHLHRCQVHHRHGRQRSEPIARAGYRPQLHRARWKRRMIRPW